MGLIKADNLTNAGVAFSLADIEQQARAMLVRAKAQADQMLAAAQQEAQVIKAQAMKEAKAAGFELGRKEGREQALPQAKAAALAEQKAKLTETVSGFAASASELDRRIAALEQAAQQELVQLAIAVARRVVKSVAERDIAVAETSIRDAIRLVMNKSSVRIGVAPQQLEALRELLPQLKMTWPTLQHVDMSADPTLAPGGCRVFSAAGEIDADLDRQLDRITRELAPGTKTPDVAVDAPPPPPPEGATAQPA